MPSVEIVSIGNELLIGKVTNSNASWLADKITRMGGKVRRIITISDDIDEIASTIHDSINRGAEVIITTGGLGPTYDDMTLAGIARCFQLELKINEEALRLVKAKYEQRGMEVTPPRKKMAVFPSGGKPVFNPVGTAPAMRLDVQGVTIYALPGVPSEMMGIFDGQIAKDMKDMVVEGFFGEAYLTIRGVPESSLAPIIDEIRKNHPMVYIKSHPSMEELGAPMIEVHFTCSASSIIEAQHLTSLAAAHMMERVEQRFGVRPELRG